MASVLEARSVVAEGQLEPQPADQQVHHAVGHQAQADAPVQPTQHPSPHSDLPGARSARRDSDSDTTTGGTAPVVNRTTGRPGHVRASLRWTEPGCEQLDVAVNGIRTRGGATWSTGREG